MTRRPTTFDAARWLLVSVCVGASALAIPGCQIVGFVAAGVQEAKENRLRKIEPQYKGLEGKSFAVVVAADRLVKAENPGVVEELTARITQRLEEHSGASGRVPANKLLAYLYANPHWVAMPRGELARELGVDRLVFIDVAEFRLNESGNQYLWDGVASATIGVIETGSALPDEYVFERTVRVQYPDKPGYGQADMPAEAVSAVLIKRFVDRASWLFYTHEEKGKMDY